MTYEQEPRVLTRTDRTLSSVNGVTLTEEEGGSFKARGTPALDSDYLILKPKQPYFWLDGVCKFALSNVILSLQIEEQELTSLKKPYLCLEPYKVRLGQNTYKTRIYQPKLGESISSKLKRIKQNKSYIDAELDEFKEDLDQLALIEESRKSLEKYHDLLINKTENDIDNILDNHLHITGLNGWGENETKENLARLKQSIKKYLSEKLESMVGKKMVHCDPKPANLCQYSDETGNKYFFVIYNDDVTIDGSKAEWVAKDIGPCHYWSPVGQEFVTTKRDLAWFDRGVAIDSNLTDLLAEELRFEANHILENDTFQVSYVPDYPDNPDSPEYNMDRTKFRVLSSLDKKGCPESRSLLKDTRQYQELQSAFARFVSKDQTQTLGHDADLS